MNFFLLFLLKELLILPIYLSLILLFASANQTWCAARYINTKDSSLNSVAISLGEVAFSQQLCTSAATSLSMFSDTDNRFLSATGQQIPAGTDPISFYINNTWTRPLTDEEKEQYWCYLDIAGLGKFSSAADWLISFLPSSPESARIPNQITKLTGDGTLASNLLLELYSGVWQVLLVMALIKFYKLIPFKAT